ncbi:MAG: hypothetical protein J4432_04355 [DPANN group archaeon]|nr:hypothetical protein [DPANN group archaeon]
MDPDKFVENAFKGMTEGAITTFKKDLKQYIERFKSGDLAFIENTETIKEIENNRKKPELKLLRRYIKSREYLLQIQIGYHLKELEENKKHKALNQLLDKVYSNWGASGRRIAEISQRGILSRYLGLLLQDANDEKSLEEQINSLLDNLDKYFLFIKAEDKPKDLERKLINKLDANSPNTMIVFSRGKKPVSIAEKTIDSIKNKVLEYNFEMQFEPNTYQRYDFIIKAISHSL